MEWRLLGADKFIPIVNVCCPRDSGLLNGKISDSTATLLRGRRRSGQPDLRPF